MGLERNSNRSAAPHLDEMKEFAFILISPRLRTGTVALAQVIANNPHVWLYSLTSDDRNLTDFTHHLLHSWPGSFKKLSTWLKALSDSDIHYLVLDQFDYLELKSDVTAFVAELAGNLPSGLQIIIHSRQLSRLFWLPFIQDGRAVAFGDEQGLFQPGPPTLEFYGLDGGRVFANGLEITEWGGPLPRHLCWYMADRGAVTRDEIFEKFWPTLPAKEATNVFHVTKRKISEALGNELTTFHERFYQRSKELNIFYDVLVFEEAIQ